MPSAFFLGAGAPMDTRSDTRAALTRLYVVALLSLRVHASLCGSSHWKVSCGTENDGETLTISGAGTHIENIARCHSELEARNDEGT